MNVLITSAGSESGRLLAESLSGSHKLRLTDEPGRAGEDVVACEFGHDEATDDLCEGINAIVHVCEPDSGLSDDEVVDTFSRKTYNLMTAAAAAGVEHVVYVSSLQLFSTSEPEYEIDEQWAPPVTTDIETLRHHIGEFVVREFARASVFPVTCLRFGKVVADDQVKPDCVTRTHFAQSVAAAIEKRPSGWSVFHVVSEGAHFKTKRAVDGLGLDFRTEEGA
jgi:nucleoside-diphosphate-sugar epimerase